MIRPKFNFLRFSLLNLAPLLLLMAAFEIFSICLNVTGGHFSFLMLPISLVFFTLFLTPIVLLNFVVFLFFRKRHSMVSGGFILYGFWTVIIFGILFVGLAAIGGASMAYNDGALSSRGLYAQSAALSLKVLLLLQAFVVPWVLLCLFLIKRFMGWPAAGGGRQNPAGNRGRLTASFIGGLLSFIIVLFLVYLIFANFYTKRVNPHLYREKEVNDYIKEKQIDTSDYRKLTDDVRSNLEEAQRTRFNDLEEIK